MKELKQCKKKKFKKKIMVKHRRLYHDIYKSFTIISNLEIAYLIRKNSDI